MYTEYQWINRPVDRQMNTLIRGDAINNNSNKNNILVTRIIKSRIRKKIIITQVLYAFVFGANIKIISKVFNLFYINPHLPYTPQQLLQKF